MIRISHQNRYIQTTKSALTEQKECIDCGGNGWIYEFYNDPVSWRTCPQCSDEKISK
ncbi:MAG TPA: hypothetical protein VFK40_12065 [Nitrososphaeraceae archaeon]|nr:hypothetical protein [Nitrososphaeraceae archaeon]HJT83677.1 hypothetical protein [Nitrososphaeraceae archaeon]